MPSPGMWYNSNILICQLYLKAEAVLRWGLSPILKTVLSVTMGIMSTSGLSLVQFHALKCWGNHSLLVYCVCQVVVVVAVEVGDVTASPVDPGSTGTASACLFVPVLLCILRVWHAVPSTTVTWCFTNKIINSEFVLLLVLKYNCRLTTAVGSRISIFLWQTVKHHVLM